MLFQGLKFSLAVDEGTVWSMYRELKNEGQAIYFNVPKDQSFSI
jgi:hypothetical protein